MRRVLALMMVVAVPVSAGAAEIDPAAVQLWDVVHTSDGSVLKGVIVEEVPGVSLRVVIIGGTSLVVQLANVTKLTRELNPAFVGGVGVARTTAVDAAPSRVATGGLRIGITPGLAQHFEGDASTFFLTARAGWELALEQWGLTPGVVVDFTPDAGNYGAEGFGVMAGMRGAYRGSSISPFLGFGLGVDAVGSDTSLGTFMGVGVDFIVHSKIALSVEAKYHRGWGNTYTQTLSFGAVGMGVEVRL